jgi:hypothetical protein
MATIPALAMVPRTDAHHDIETNLFGNADEPTDIAPPREIKCPALLLVVDPKDVHVDHIEASTLHSHELLSPFTGWQTC